MLEGAKYTTMVNFINMPDVASDDDVESDDEYYPGSIMNLF